MLYQTVPVLASMIFKNGILWTDLKYLQFCCMCVLWVRLEEVAKIREPSYSACLTAIEVCHKQKEMKSCLNGTTNDIASFDSPSILSWKLERRHSQQQNFVQQFLL